MTQAALTGKSFKGVHTEIGKLGRFSASPSALKAGSYEPTKELGDQGHHTKGRMGQQSCRRPLSLTTAPNDKLCAFIYDEHTFSIIRNPTGDKTRCARP